MTPEQLLALGPSVTAMFVALVGAFTQWRMRLADDKRFAEQRESDDRRWLAQREADGTRFSAEREAEIVRISATHEHSLQLRRIEDAVQSARDYNERLRGDAAEFVSVLGEAQSAIEAVHERYELLAREGRWGESTFALEPWTSDLRIRLTMATAMMSLYGGDVARAARSIRGDLLFGFDSMADFYGRESNHIPQFARVDEGLDKFIAAVMEHSAGRAFEPPSP